MQEAIDSTKSIIKDQVSVNKIIVNGIPFSKYQKVYFKTNENIKDYLDYINLDNKENALTVAGSGDHLFNLISNDILSVDMFDTNKLCEYYIFGIRFAMIFKYDYKEYLSVYYKLIDENTNIDTISSIISDLLPYMDNKYRIYWENIIDYNYNIQKEHNTNLNLIYMLFICITRSIDIKLCNKFLFSEEEYNKLRINLCKANITFNNYNAVDLDKYYNNKYDLILLSNILDYTLKGCNINDYDVYKNKINSLLKDSGYAFMKYIFYFSNNDMETKYIFRNSMIDKYQIKDNIIKVNSPDKDNLYDGVILMKKY